MQQLQEQNIFATGQFDRGLTSLNSEGIYSLMTSDYPLKCESDSEKYKVKKKAVKSAADFNAVLMKDRRSDRRACLDLQTFEIHNSDAKVQRLSKNEARIYTFPAMVMPGQFQDDFKRYSKLELKYFPVNTALYSPHKYLKSIYADPNNSDHQDADCEMSLLNQECDTQCVVEKTVSDANVVEIRVSDDSAFCNNSLKRSCSKPIENNNKFLLANGKKAAYGKQINASLCRNIKASRAIWPNHRSQIKPPAMRIVKVNKIKKKCLSSLACAVCNQTEKCKLGVSPEFVRCSECHIIGHPNCLELTQEMIPIIKTYSWQCMDCKTCAKCKDSHDEEKMMFCDHCDRGFHTFCVGLEALPDGRWECPSCSVKKEEVSGKVKPKRGRPFKYPKPNIYEPVMLGQSSEIMPALRTTCDSPTQLSPNNSAKSSADCRL